MSEDQVIQHLSELNGWFIIEIQEWKSGVKKIFCKSSKFENHQLGIFFIKDENLISLTIPLMKEK